MSMSTVCEVKPPMPTSCNQSALSCRSYFIQWTLFNCLLVINLMMTHNGCAWTDRTGIPRQQLWFCGERPQPPLGLSAASACLQMLQQHSLL